MSRLFARGGLVAATSMLMLGAAACDGGTGPRAALTPEQVGGIYRICSLAYAPAGPGRPPLDLRAMLTDTLPRPGLPSPQVRVSLTRHEFALEFVPPDDVLERQFRGTYRVEPRSITLDFPNPTEIMATLLLPGSLNLAFSENPRTLVIPATYAEHRVPKADYQRLAGIVDPNLADPVVGALTGRFVVGDCP
jgi:hypothetical protein